MSFVRLPVWSRLALPRLTVVNSALRRGSRNATPMAMATTPPRIAKIQNLLMSDQRPMTAAAVVASVHGGVVDQEGDHRTDDRPDEPRGLNRSLVEILAEYRPSDEAADERAHDAEQQRARDRHRITTGYQQARNPAGDQRDDGQHDEKSDH